MCFFYRHFTLKMNHHTQRYGCQISRVGTDVTVTGMDPCGFEGVEPPNRAKLCRCRRLSAVRVDRSTLDERFVPRSPPGSSQGNDKHTTATVLRLGRVMVPHRSAVAIA